MAWAWDARSEVAAVTITRRKTAYVTLACTLVLLAWELLAYRVGQDATISRTAWGAPELLLYPLLVALVFTLGHIFWPPAMCRVCGSKHPAGPRPEDLADFALRYVTREPVEIEGSWSRDDPRRWFVDGVAWWEFHKTGATLWPSDRDLAEAEATKRRDGSR